MDKVVTFDFDGCLSRPDVQKYAKELLDRGVDVWVVTSRYDNLNLHRYEGMVSEENWNHDDIWNVVDSIGIPRWKVRFTNMEWKSVYLEGTKAIWHLDDNHRELYMIKEARLKTTGIQVVSGTWKQKCQRLLNKK